MLTDYKILNRFSLGDKVFTKKALDFSNALLVIIYLESESDAESDLPSVRKLYKEIAS